MPRFRTLPNPISVTIQLISQLKIKVTKTAVIDKLENHPEYPSLLAISDCLTEFSIPNQAFKIDKNEFNIQDLEFPFVAHFSVSGGIYSLIHNIKDESVTYSNEKVSRSAMPLQEFLKVWSGVVLHAEASKESGEEGYRANLVAEIINRIKLPLLAIIIAAIIFLSIDGTALSLGYFSLLIIKMLGLGTSILLLTHSVDANNPLVQNLCSLGNKNGCNAILKSDAAKVFSWLSWSEVGFFYFAGTFISLLLVPNSLQLITWLNLLALPYTVYSVSYQYRENNWCVLCCAVQVVLLLEFVVNISFNSVFTFQNFAVQGWKDWMLLDFAFLLPILSWYVIKAIVVKSTLVNPLKGQLKKFKYNSDLFNQLLTSQPKYGIADELMPIKMGNPNAETVITMVSNPFCGPCAKAHQQLDEWLKHRDDIQLKIIFTTADHDNDERTKMSRHMNALSLLQDVTLVENALNDWYKLSEKKYDTWAAKYPISFNGEMSKATAKQKAWCDLAEISFTPTILVNGYKLPAPYQLEDIKYLVT